MAEYIEREQALDVINLADFTDDHGLLLWADSVQACLLDIPSADVVPVVHGEWIRIAESMWKCSHCGNGSCCRGNYCPDCGADMRPE